MSNHSENSFFAVSDSVSFDINVHSCGFYWVESWNYNTVSWGNWILYWNPMPGGVLIRNGVEYYMEPSRVFLLPPYTTYSTRGEAPFRHFYIHFTAPDPFGRVDRQIFSFDADQIVQRSEELASGSAGHVQSLLLRLITYEYLLQIPPQAFLADERKAIDPRIKLAVSYMEQNLGVHQDNRRLARRIGLNLNSFYDLFMNEIGTSPKRYLQNMRLEEARRLLIHTGRTIDEIAVATGYADRYHFSKAFKRFYSSSPAAYRRNCGRGGEE